MKKVTLVAVISLFAVLLLAGCSSDSQATGGVAQTETNTVESPEPAGGDKYTSNGEPVSDLTEWVHAISGEEPMALYGTVIFLDKKSGYMGLYYGEMVCLVYCDQGLTSKYEIQENGYIEMMAKPDHDYSIGEESSYTDDEGVINNVSVISVPCFNATEITHYEPDEPVNYDGVDFSNLNK